MDTTGGELGMKQRGFILPSPSMIMAGIIIALSISNVIFIKLYSHEVSAYAKFQADVAKAQEQLQADADKARLLSERINKDTADGWAAALRVVSGRPAIRVQPCGDSSGLRPVPGPTSATHGAAAQLQPSADGSITVEQCQAIANNAVADTTQLIYLQDWVNRQSEIAR